jgi:ABC-type branched-subunit amino acid transport system ATPase component
MPMRTGAKKSKSSDWLCEVANLHKRYGGLTALAEVSIGLATGCIHAIIGPNGAGKTTLFDVISGLCPLDAGQIFFEGAAIGRRHAWERAALGIARTFQTTQLFEHLNVIANIAVGRYVHTQLSFCEAGLWTPRVYRREHHNLRRSFEVLEFLDLYPKADRQIRQLSYHERKLVALGRCLAMDPKLLLLDEPFGGLHRREIESMAAMLVRLRRRGLTLAVIDHHFGTLADIADEIVVLNHGRIIAKGKPDRVRRDAAVLDAYLTD